MQYSENALSLLPLKPESLYGKARRLNLFVELSPTGADLFNEGLQIYLTF